MNQAIISRCGGTAMGMRENLLINSSCGIWQAAKAGTLTSTFQRVADGFYAKGSGTVEKNMGTSLGGGMAIVPGLIISATGPVTIVQEINTSLCQKAVWTACVLKTYNACQVEFGKSSFTINESGAHKLVALPVNGKSSSIKYFSLTLPAGTFFVTEAQAVEADGPGDIPPFCARPYLQELQLCEKYYRERPYSKVGHCISTAAFMLDYGLYADMAKPPAITLTSKALVANAANHGSAQTEITGITQTPDVINRWLIQFNKASLTLNNPIFASVAFDAYNAPSLA